MLCANSREPCNYVILQEADWQDGATFAIPTQLRPVIRLQTSVRTKLLSTMTVELVDHRPAGIPEIADWPPLQSRR